MTAFTDNVVIDQDYLDNVDANALTEDHSIAAGHTITFDFDSSEQYAGVISGEGNVAYHGSGQKSITANNTFTGMVIQGGSGRLSASNTRFLPTAVYFLAHPDGDISMSSSGNDNPVEIGGLICTINSRPSFRTNNRNIIINVAAGESYASGLANIRMGSFDRNSNTIIKRGAGSQTIDGQIWGGNSATKFLIVEDGELIFDNNGEPRAKNTAGVTARDSGVIVFGANAEFFTDVPSTLMPNYMTLENGGSFRFTNSGNIGSGNFGINIIGSGAIELNGLSSNHSFRPPITGTGDFTLTNRFDNTLVYFHEDTNLNGTFTINRGTAFIFNEFVVNSLVLDSETSAATIQTAITLPLLLGEGTVSVNENITLTLDQSQDFTFPGKFTGEGTVSKISDFTLTLSDDSDISNMQVLAGNLQLGTSGITTSNAGNIIIGDTGRLSGNTNIGGAVSFNGNGGFLSPGINGIGSFNIDGNLTFDTNSTYDVDFNSQLADSIIVVSGDLTIAGNLELYPAIDTYLDEELQLLSNHNSNAAFNGEFSNVNTNNPENLGVRTTHRVVYDTANQRVFLDIEIEPLFGILLPGNDKTNLPPGYSLHDYRSTTGEDYFWAENGYQNNTRQLFVIDAHPDNTENLLFFWVDKQLSLAPGRSAILFRPPDEEALYGEVVNYTLTSTNDPNQRFRDCRIIFNN